MGCRNLWEPPCGHLNRRGFRCNLGSHPLASERRKEKAELVALAGWASDPIDIRLNIDWEKLDMDPVRTVLRAPDIQNFQKAAVFQPTDKVPMDPGKGWLLILEERIN